MSCEGCTEFLVQGSGTVGAGDAFSYEKVVIAEDPDNIPLVLLSVKALDKDDVLLVDPTPAWLEATTSGQSVQVGSRLVYRLTVTVEIDAVRILDPEDGDPSEWGEGTYTIELRAQVEDASKPVIVCLFDVCVSGTVSALSDFVVLHGLTAAASIDAWDKSSGTFVALLRSVTAAQAIRGGVAVDGVQERIHWVEQVGGNNSHLFSMPFDGLSETDEIDITNAQGAPANWMAIDEVARLAWVSKPSMIVEIDLSLGTGSYSQTKIGADATGKGTDFGMTFDPVIQRVYYGFQNVSTEIRYVAYGAGTGVADTTVAVNTDFTDAGLTSESEIQAMAWNPTTGLLYCCNEAGEFFSCDPTTGACVKLIDNTEWDFFGAMNGRPLGMQIDDFEEVAYMAATRSTAPNYIMKIPITTPLTNTAHALIVDNVNHIIWGFDLAPTLVGS